MNDINNNELYHYGVKGMKWGVRRGSAAGSISQRTKKDKEQRKDALDSILDPSGNRKRRRKQAEEREKRQSEINDIVQAKGKAKVYKILKKIGKNLINPVVVDAPKGPKRKPWDEKPDPNNRGGRI